MAISEAEVCRRLREAARAVDPALVVEPGSVRWVAAPYAGVYYNLVLGEAHALLFLPAEDLQAPDADARVRQRLEAARRYLGGFTTARRASIPAGPARTPRP
jgi:hypothetical protein